MENQTTTAFADQWTIMTNWISNTLKQLSDDDLANHIAPQRNHGIWILGHLIFSEDELAVYLGKDNFLFPEYETLFGMGTPLLPVQQYPPAQVLREQWAQVVARNRQVLANVSDAEWNEPHTRIGSQDPLDDFFKTKGRTWAIWILHQTLHLGQLNTLLRKA
jgi:hypothetical protein